MMIRRGEIRAFKIGKLLRISVEEVARWGAGVAEAEEPATTEPERLAEALRLAKMTISERKPKPRR
jgi:hypothetical protein